MSKNRKDYNIGDVKRVLNPGIALFLLPACFGVLQALAGTARNFEHVPEESFYFFLGVFGYLAFQWAFFKPMRTYVFGHELTHAMAAWVTGGEVKSFHVSKKGGAVTLTKTNLFVALAPYIIPVYAVFLLILFYGAKHLYDFSPYWHLWLAAFGAAMGFHAALTFYALKQNQPDLKMGGTLLSGVLIFLGNAVCLVLFLGVLFPRTVSWSHICRQTGAQTLHIYRQIGQTGIALCSRGQGWLYGHRH